MPRHGAIIFADLIGKLDLLRVSCEKCERDGRAYLTIPRAAAARMPARIVELIRHAKSTDAAHGCPALLNGEETAIGAARTRRILGTPSSIIAGESVGGCLR